MKLRQAIKLLFSERRPLRGSTWLRMMRRLLKDAHKRDRITRDNQPKGTR